MSTQQSRNIFTEELCKYFMDFLQSGFKSTRFQKRYIRLKDEITKTVEDIATENNNSCFLSEIASKTFFSAEEYLPILITLNNLINLNNLNKNVSFTPDIKKGSIAIRSINVQKLNM